MRRAWDKLSVCVWRSLLAASVEGALGSRRAADLSRLKSFFCVSHLLHRLFDVCGRPQQLIAQLPFSLKPNDGARGRGHAGSRGQRFAQPAGAEQEGRNR